MYTIILFLVAFATSNKLKRVYIYIIFFLPLFKSSYMLIGFYNCVVVSQRRKKIVFPIRSPFLPARTTDGLNCAILLYVFAMKNNWIRDIFFLFYSNFFPLECDDQIKSRKALIYYGNDRVEIIVICVCIVTMGYTRALL